MSSDSDKANDTVDRLFNEEFKPEWMMRRERSIRESLEEALTVSVEFNYRQSAKEKAERIIAKTNGGVWYNNG